MISKLFIVSKLWYMLSWITFNSFNNFFFQVVNLICWNRLKVNSSSSSTWPAKRSRVKPWTVRWWRRRRWLRRRRRRRRSANCPGRCTTPRMWRYRRRRRCCRRGGRERRNWAPTRRNRPLPNWEVPRSRWVRPLTLPEFIQIQQFQFSH